MKVERPFSRRRLLGLSMAAGGLAAAGHLVPATAAERLRRTPAQILGPFYPMTKPQDQDADLTAIQGRSGKAAGQVIYVMGRVLDMNGKPVQGARIDIWQANTHGRYVHPSDTNPAPLDPNFEGFASLVSDAQGRYRIKTIKPGAYPADGVMRPPHIHFDVIGKVNRVVTQMYFAGEPQNAKDGLLNTVRNPERLIVSLKDPTADLEVSSRLATFDLVLEHG